MSVRVVVDTQSNKLFRGSKEEQDYDQRGLCQAGKGDVLVTTSPIDPDYLRYWAKLGFTLPTFVNAGPFDENCTLAELVAHKPDVQEQIRSAVNGLPARIELFWVTHGDTALQDVLNIPAYCNIEASIRFACKHAFKLLCDEIGLGTAPWVGGHSIDEALEAYQRSNFAEDPVLVKAANSTGGVELGAMKRFNSADHLAKAREEISGFSMPIVIERIMDIAAEATVHWEIDTQSRTHVIGVFDQLSKNYSYAGTALPTALPPVLQSKIRQELIHKFVPALQKVEARGFFCCDVLIMDDGTVLWTDLNPRKGAILYVYDMTRRLAAAHGLSHSQLRVWHEHATFQSGIGFQDVQNVLGSLLVPSKDKPFVVLTNPGVILNGSVDLTGISCMSREAAHSAVHDAKKLLSSAFG